MKILSWNVNGLRACAKKGFSTWLDNCNADIVGLQEVRALPQQLDASLVAPKGYHVAFSPAERLGYSGVAIYTRSAPDNITTLLGQSPFDCEGRIQIARFGRLVVANVYFPNGSGKDRDNSRVQFKLDFYDSLFTHLQNLRRGGARVIVMGDFNTAHRDIDLALPKANEKTSGFLPEERAELDRWLAAGWTDTFRLYNDEPGHYSWWSQRGGARARNVGWRIDYAYASHAALPFVESAHIYPDDLGSDHCPIGLVLREDVVG